MDEFNQNFNQEGAENIEGLDETVGSIDDIN